MFKFNVVNKNQVIENMSSIPKKIFVVPYRSRPEQKFFFCKYMKFLLEHTSEYEIYFSHQCDKRSFNRGAMRNIGFLAMKQKYPDHYRDMTFIFNDLDTIPFNRIFDYETSVGVVNHYYGFAHSLGGIVVMKGSDFEKVNGYPNFWSWGLEDSCLQKRCLAAGLKIDRTDFYKIGSPEILQLFDGVDRIINKKDPHRLKTDDGTNGLSTLHKLDYSISKKSDSDVDNIYDALGDHFYYINTTSFLSETRFEDDEYFKYDLREPVQNITNPVAHRRTRNVNVSPSEWSNISYYPTTQERTGGQTPPRYVDAPANVAMPTPRNATHLAASRHVPTMPSPTPTQRTQTAPRTFKQLRSENIAIFPPKTTKNAGGAAAINKINLRYRMAKI